MKKYAWLMVAVVLALVITSCAQAAAPAGPVTI